MYGNKLFFCVACFMIFHTKLFCWNMILSCVKSHIHGYFTWFFLIFLGKSGYMDISHVCWMFPGAQKPSVFMWGNYIVVPEWGKEALVIYGTPMWETCEETSRPVYRGMHLRLFHSHYWHVSFIWVLLLPPFFLLHHHLFLLGSVLTISGRGLFFRKENTSPCLWRYARGRRKSQRIFHHHHLLLSCK
jgi:hypothetical protein